MFSTRFLADHRCRKRLGSRVGVKVRLAGCQGSVHRRGPQQLRGNGETDHERRPRVRGQSVHGERCRFRRGYRARGQSRTGPGPCGNIDQQRGRHLRAHVLGCGGTHHRVHHQHKPARSVLGELTYYHIIL